MFRFKTGPLGGTLTRRPVASTLLVIGAFLVAACSGEPEGADRYAGVTKDVNWCFTNNGKGGTPPTIYFGISGWTRESYYFEGGGGGDGGPVTLTEGMTVCSSGGTAIGQDRVAEITFHNGRKTKYAAWNQILTPPQFFAAWTGSLMGAETFDVGEEHVYEFHYNRVRVKRLPDTETIEFRISFEGEVPPA